MNQNLFGTDGIRVTVGTPPLTYEALPTLGRAIAAWAQKKYGETPTILLGHDTRVSCSFVKAGLKYGLLTSAVTLHDANVLPTPAVFQISHHNKKFDCGIIISASHNPYQDNGIKIIDPRVGKITHHDELTITELFYATPETPVLYNLLGVDMPYLSANDDYKHQMLNYFEPTLLTGKKIVLDCAHGATHQSAPAIFAALGADTVVLNNQPDGYNINKGCGALHQAALQKAVIMHNADAGFAFDGDGDRVIAVNRNGIVKDGDDLLALLLEHPVYKKTAAVVGTIMTNQGFEQYLKRKMVTLVRTPVGDKYIAEQLQSANLLLGGEQSGHIIVRDYSMTGDGIFTALRTLESIKYNNNWDMHTFTKFPQILINVPVTVKKDLKSHPLATLIKASQDSIPDGRLVVRYSGTENLLRIMIEDSNLSVAQAVGEQLSQQLLQALTP